MRAEWSARLRRWTTLVVDGFAGRRGRVWQVALWFVAVLIGMRVCAPFVLTGFANRALADGEEVRGSITGLSLSLVTCNYTVHGLQLRVRRADGRWRPLLAAERIVCELRWLPLLRGELSGRITVERPVLEVFAETPPTVQEIPIPLARPAPHHPATPPWQDAVRTVVRLHLSEVSITDGVLRYHDERRELTASIDRIEAQVRDLTVPEPALAHRSAFALVARTPGDGTLRLDGEVDILARRPTFLVRAELAHVELPRLNPLTRSYDNLTFSSGTFHGYAELVADGRKIGGYLKVLFHHLDIHSIGSSDPGSGTVSFWGLVVEAAEEVLENTDHHQHAARIPLRGPLDDPDTDVWTALGTALRNAFVRALAPGFESARRPRRAGPGSLRHRTTRVGRRGVVQERAAADPSVQRVATGMCRAQGLPRPCARPSSSSSP